MTYDGVTLVEVGPRDGFQSVGPIIPTAQKIAILERLHAAGVRRVEAASFVSLSTLPQLAEAAEVIAAAYALPGLEPQVLVPTARQAERALKANARHLAFVLSVSEQHNRSNVRRSPKESAEEYQRIVSLLPSGTKLRVNIATAFDCPYDGKIGVAATLALLDQLVPMAPDAEIALCDTTGRVTPDHVRDLCVACFKRFPQVRKWAFHAHDTYGLGAANVLTAWNAGIRTMDSSVAGLGGCPFAPDATGNVATEDLVWMFEGMGVATGIDLPYLVTLAREISGFPGAQTGGWVRQALMLRRRPADEAA